MHETGERLAAELVAVGARVLLDDRRGVSAGVKFADAELLGMPTSLIVGHGLADGVVELRDRASGRVREVAVADAVTQVRLEVGRP
jgi:prolyl-tRNA synthetase